MGIPVVLAAVSRCGGGSLPFITDPLQTRKKSVPARNLDFRSKVAQRIGKGGIPSVPPAANTTVCSPIRD